MQRSKSSTFARLTRSVSKLGSGRSARAAQEAAAVAAAAAARGGGAAPPSAGHRRVGSSEGVGSMGGGGAAAGSSAAPRSGKSAGLGDFAAGSAARIKLFEAGHFNLEADLGSLTGGGGRVGGWVGADGWMGGLMGVDGSNGWNVKPPAPASQAVHGSDVPAPLPQPASAVDSASWLPARPRTRCPRPLQRRALRICGQTWGSWMARWRLT
jgi:hypothetical protein